MKYIDFLNRKKLNRTIFIMSFILIVITVAITAFLVCQPWDWL